MVNPTGYTALDLIGFTDKGAYSPVVNYVRNDLSHNGGSIWRCLIDDTINITPAEGANWTLFIAEPTNTALDMIAPTEISPSEHAYAAGAQLIFNDTLYTVTTAIAVNDALVVGTNITASDTLTTQINNPIEAMVNVYGSKNLLPYPYTDTTQVKSGITFTDNNGIVTANGSLSSGAVHADFTCHSSGTNGLLLPAGTYTINGCPAGGSLSTYCIYVYSNDGGSLEEIAYDFGEGASFTLNGIKKIGIKIDVAQASISNKVFHPMIRDSRITDSTYVPYAMTNRELTENNVIQKGQLTYNTNIVSSSTNEIGIIKRGNIVTLNISYVELESITANTWAEFGYLPNGFKPSTSYSICSIGIYCTTSGNPIDVARVVIGTNGTISIKIPSTPGSKWALSGVNAVYLA